MLLQRNIVKKYLNLLSEEQIAKPWAQYTSYFLNEDIQANIQKIKEEQFQEGFLRELFVKVLGYTLNPSPDYNLITEKKNETNSKKADGAILLDDKVIGVIDFCFAGTVNPNMDVARMVSRPVPEEFEKVFLAQFADEVEEVNRMKLAWKHIDAGYADHIRTNFPEINLNQL